MSMNPTLPQAFVPHRAKPPSFLPQTLPPLTFPKFGTLEKFIQGKSSQGKSNNGGSPNNMGPEKWLVILVLCMLQLVLLFQLESENDAVKAENEQLQSALAAERTQNIEKVEALESEIIFQQDLQEQLREELSALEATRNNINTTANENKAAIRRIRDADSLYRAVARHYQP